jgi:hypothetical protein
LQRCFHAVARVGPQHEPQQGQAHFADQPHRRDHGQDNGWQGCVCPRLIVRAYAATAVRPKEADQVTRHGAEPCIAMGAPPAFLLDHLVPRLHERLHGPAPIRQGSTGAAHGICGQSPVGQCWEDGTPTEQEPPRDERPEQPEQPQIGADGHIGQYRTQTDRNTVD